MTKATAAPEKQKNNTSLLVLRSWNTWLALLYALQGAVILLLSTTKSLPVQTGYLAQDPSASELAGHPVVAGAVRHLFDVNLAWVVAVFLLIAAVAHGLAATVIRNRYEADLKRRTNLLRWAEYGVGGAVMLIAIALISGVYDIATLLAIAAFSLIMSAVGLLAELYGSGKGKLGYAIGVALGLAPWIIFAIYAGAAGLYGQGLPGYVYWIYASVLILFAAQVVNACKQFKKEGKWKDYFYGERIFMILGFVAKTLLAWLIFAGALRP